MIITKKNRFHTGLWFCCSYLLISCVGPVLFAFLRNSWQQILYNPYLIIATIIIFSFAYLACTQINKLIAKGRTISIIFCGLIYTLIYALASKLSYYLVLLMLLLINEPRALTWALLDGVIKDIAKSILIMFGWKNPLAIVFTIPMGILVVYCYYRFYHQQHISK